MSGTFRCVFGNSSFFQTACCATCRKSGYLVFPPTSLMNCSMARHRRTRSACAAIRSSLGRPCLDDFAATLRTGSSTLVAPEDRLSPSPSNPILLGTDPSLMLTLTEPECAADARTRPNNDFRVRFDPENEHGERLWSIAHCRPLRFNSSAFGWRRLRHANAG